MELKSDNIQDRPEQQQQQMQQQQQEQQEQQHFHVLAVDDSVIDRKLLEKLLKVSSYQGDNHDIIIKQPFFPVKSSTLQTIHSNLSISLSFYLICFFF